ncbi:MAG: ADP-ribosylation factor-like protein, partial [Candidatus Heimdallarchaeota archaeon]
MTSNLSDEEVVNLEEECSSVLEEWKEKKLRKTKKKLINNKPVFFIPKDDYIFALLADLDDKPKEFEFVIDSLITILAIQESEENNLNTESDLKKTIADAISYKLGSKKKEKSALKTLSIYRNRNKDHRNKFFLIGLGKVGKSSVYYQFFENWSIERLEKITATIGISQKKVNDDQSKEKLLINDLGGQEKFREQYLSDPTYFHAAAWIIFLVDCQEIESLYSTEDYFSKILEQIDTDPHQHRPLISIFIHKYDPIRKKELEANIFEHWMPVLDRVFRKYQPPYFLTSIYDNTAREAMARFFLQSMPEYLLSYTLNSEVVLTAAKSLYPILDKLDPIIDDDINVELVETDLYESAQQFGIHAAQRIAKQWQKYLLNQESNQEKLTEGNLELKVEKTGQFEVKLNCPIPVDKRRTELCAITH